MMFRRDELLSESPRWKMYEKGLKMADEFHVRTTRTYAQYDLKLSFEWFGGAYIEVSPGEQFAHPREVINVWDYERNEPRYERTVNGFQMAIDSWVDSYGIENLVHDVRENW